MLDPLTAAEEICKIFPVNRRSAYKLFKLGLAAVFVISKLHSNRSEQGFSGFHMANNFQPIRLLIYGSYDYFQSLQNILIVKSKQVESCNFTYHFKRYFGLFCVPGFHLYNCIVIQTAFVFKRTDVISSFLLSFIHMLFLKKSNWQV